MARRQQRENGSLADDDGCGDHARRSGSHPDQERKMPPRPHPLTAGSPVCCRFSAAGSAPESKPRTPTTGDGTLRGRSEDTNRGAAFHPALRNGVVGAGVVVRQQWAKARSATSGSFEFTLDNRLFKLDLERDQVSNDHPPCREPVAFFPIAD